ncbi:MAG: DUF1398 family protein [Chitinophagaceae bacterium]
MFTLEQIKAAHSNVKSGADFPNYVNDIVKLGVIAYDTYVADGHTEYFGKGSFRISSGQRYDPLSIQDKSQGYQFQKDLKEHQQGKTDYYTFCRLCAGLGINRWRVDTEKMTCTYYDNPGNEVLVEKIPAVSSGN